MGTLTLTPKPNPTLTLIHDLLMFTFMVHKVFHFHVYLCLLMFAMFIMFGTNVGMYVSHAY